MWSRRENKRRPGRLLPKRLALRHMPGREGAESRFWSACSSNRARAAAEAFACDKATGAAGAGAATAWRRLARRARNARACSELRLGGATNFARGKAGAEASDFGNASCAVGWPTEPAAAAGDTFAAAGAEAAIEEALADVRSWTAAGAGASFAELAGAAEAVLAITFATGTTTWAGAPTPANVACGRAELVVACTEETGAANFALALAPTFLVSP